MVLLIGRISALPVPADRPRAALSAGPSVSSWPAQANCLKDGRSSGLHRPRGSAVPHDYASNMGTAERVW